MSTRFSSKALSTAAVGIAVAVFGLGVAGATPVAKTSTVPIAGIKLVSETSIPPSEVAAAARNGGHSSIKGRRPNFTHDYRDASRNAGELVAVDIR